MPTPDLRPFLDHHMTQAGAFVPGRLQALIALLERLRETPELKIQAHLAKAGQSLIRHESYGNQAMIRLGLEHLNKNHGRRSSNLGAWGQPLLDLLAEEGFASLAPIEREQLIDQLQAQAAKPLQAMLNEEPLTVRIKGRSAIAVVSDILDQAEAKGQLAAVSQYLVGAKLQLRLPSRANDVLVLGANKGDRKSRSDEASRRGDFDLGDYVFEVTVGLPDTKHLAQIEEALEDAHAEMWLLVRRNRHALWTAETEQLDIDHNRLVIASIELFVGQNIAELGELSVDGQREQLAALFTIYNEQWIPTV